MVSGSVTLPLPEGRPVAGPPCAATTTASASSLRADLKERRLIEIDRQRLVVTIGNRTLTIAKLRIEDGTAGLKLTRLLNRYAGSQTIIDGNACVVGDHDEQSAVLHELLQIHHSSQPHSAAHVVSLIREMTPDLASDPTASRESARLASGCR